MPPLLAQMARSLRGLRNSVTDLQRRARIRLTAPVAELARAGLTPDWMPGAVVRCVPVEVKRGHHGKRATTMVVGSERVLYRSKWRTVEVLACPVTYSPHPQQIAAVRQAYEDWWQALDWVREDMEVSGMLREIEVTAAMPKVRSWARLSVVR